MDVYRFKRKAAACAIAVALIVTHALTSTGHAQTQPGEPKSTETKSRIGFDIAPVRLNLAGKNPDLVGLGSYIVNAQAGCNDCHSAGPVTLFAPGGNPYFGQLPAKINPATYLGGGRDFGPLTPNSANIVSRNLTPDKTGKPMGDGFEKFLETIRTGGDPDHVHPTCSANVSGPCIPPPFNGDLLQIMPWPAYSRITEHDLRAIYEYLSAVPCVEGGPGEQPGRCQ
jgi:hypothetical protein